MKSILKSTSISSAQQVSFQIQSLFVIRTCIAHLTIGRDSANIGLLIREICNSTNSEHKGCTECTLTLLVADLKNHNGNCTAAG